jgi:hypothetical protein
VKGLAGFNGMWDVTFSTPAARAIAAADVSTVPVQEGGNPSRGLNTMILGPFTKAGRDFGP